MGFVFGGLVLLLTSLFVLSLLFGSVSIPADEVIRALLGQEVTRQSWVTIVQDYRLPKALTAVLAGAALAAAGLALQSLFRNPLADSYVLGVSSGAGLGVALVILTAGVGTTTLLSGLGLVGNIAVIAAASIGAAAVLVLVLLIARRVQHLATLLIVGLMIGYAAGAAVTVLTSTAIPEQLQAYVNWTFGTFGDVTRSQLGLFAVSIAVGIAILVTLAKPLNAMSLGEDAALALGVNVHDTRRLTLIGAAVLTGTVTAFCGPIGFVGVAVPYLARVLLRTGNHILLLPATLLLGSCLALTADLIAQLPGSERILPLNAVIALFGVPIVIWVLLHERRYQGAL